MQDSCNLMYQVDAQVVAACSEGIFMIYTVMPDADFAPRTVVNKWSLADAPWDINILLATCGRSYLILGMTRYDRLKTENTIYHCILFLCIQVMQCN